MQVDLEQFIDERAEQLAIVYLSRSPELTIERLPSDFGLDMLVTVCPDQSPSGRVFGVQVKARHGLFDKSVQSLASSLLQTDDKIYKDLPFPVFTVVFTMDDDKGYSNGLSHPHPGSDRPSTTRNDEWRSIDEYSVHQLISDVNNWYGSRRHMVA